MPPCRYRIFPRNQLAIFTPAGEKGFQSVLPKQTALIIIKVYLCANGRIGFVFTIRKIVQNSFRINFLPLILQCLTQHQQTGLLQTIIQRRMAYPFTLFRKTIGNININRFCILRNINHFYILRNITRIS